ncbi:putative toxin-antitoxin system toxin component, PIN family [bacterium]|nr:putative toxin-antitoxin system toxin component, PIN family [bacterium]
MRTTKVVIDTNVFVSAAVLKKASSVIMEMWKNDKFILLFSPDIFDEYFEVIARPKFKQEERDIRELAKLLTERAVVVEPQIQLDVVKDDPDDNKFLECAMAGKADFIISGDHHLLSIKEYKQIKILTIAQFIEFFV